MTRAILFLIGCAVILVAGMYALLWYDEHHLPDNARAALNSYIQYRYASPPRIVQFTRATTPAKFDRDMSGISFGASVFFRTMQDYRKPVAINLPNKLTVTPQIGGYEPTRPIPFPPTDVWCIVLQSENEPSQVVFVALHQDFITPIG